jgi:hypothetical protein
LVEGLLPVGAITASAARVAVTARAITEPYESSRVDDDDEETVELGESHLSLLKYRLTARHLHIKPRDDN